MTLTSLVEALEADLRLLSNEARKGEGLAASISSWFASKGHGCLLWLCLPSLVCHMPNPTILHDKWLCFPIIYALLCDDNYFTLAETHPNLSYQIPSHSFYFFLQADGEGPDIPEEASKALLILRQQKNGAAWPEAVQQDILRSV